MRWAPTSEQLLQVGLVIECRPAPVVAMLCFPSSNLGKERPARCGAIQHLVVGPWAGQAPLHIVGTGKQGNEDGLGLPPTSRPASANPIAAPRSPVTAQQSGLRFTTNRPSVSESTASAECPPLIVGELPFYRSAPGRVVIAIPPVPVALPRSSQDSLQSTTLGHPPFRHQCTEVGSLPSSALNFGAHCGRKPGGIVLRAALLLLLPP